MTINPPLVVNGVSISYGKKQVLHEVSFAMEQGEIFGLIGQNGAGKTTLIRMILNLIKGKGDVSLFGVNHEQHTARNKLIYMPEMLQPSSRLKGWEYLSLVLASYSMKLDRDKASKIAEEMAFDVKVLKDRISTYSKGMGQKLGLIAVFLTELPLLLLDEPMSGLDPMARVKFKDSLLAENKKGRSVFFSSHILADIEEICTRIGVLHEGKLIYLGKPDDFIAQNKASSLERAFLKAIT